MNINLGLTATAGGTVDVLTATYSPFVSLYDRAVFFLRINGGNTSTTPTLNINSTGAKAIVKDGNPVLANDLLGVIILMYDLANDWYELITPRGINLNADQLEAIANANAPTLANPFATMADVGGTTPTLAQVLDTDNKTGQTNIVSDDGKTVLSIINGSATLSYTDAVGNPFITLDQTNFAGGYNNVATGESVYFYFDASGFLVSSATLPVNINTTALNFNGVQVATVNDISGFASTADVPIVEIMTGSLAVFSPSDSTTTYIGSATPLTPNANPALRQFQLPAGTVKSAWIWVEPTTTVGSTENVTYNLRNITAGTSTLIGTLTYDARSRANFVSGLSITVNASDFYSVEIVNPAFATNPVNCYTICKIVIYP